ncbi:hypothetical protein J31TS6_18950 [Brevibacillus reuszeri]|uniref:hypothetical protein n=1 Tax=Brevibacillus reuszeri TaxID=54915 RepID=UPI001B1E891A|nr:hypothetical protein [Brevibacillus reuszeri]GIO05867.1 hypothetical protein J31TS6_18950 [Brevibacillus reuszeri]
MSRRLVGFGFCFCAALLFMTYYLGASIFSSREYGFDQVIFSWIVEETFAWLLPVFAGIFLLAGIIYLALAEIRGDK